MTSDYAPSRRANKIADWMEITALLHRTPVSADTLQQTGRRHGFTHPDIAVGINTVSRRSGVLGSAYPFRSAGGGIAATAGALESPWTPMLLMASESPARAALGITAAAAHLERIVTAALAGLYGPSTCAIRFAWPSDEGRPAEFPEAIRWLADKMSVPVGGAYRPPYRKDGGVDVVAWRPFPDGRSGFPVLLVQCTLERDYSHKAADIDLRIWSSWLSLDSDPATALAIPEVVPAGEEWNALAARTVVLDRIRLAGLVAAASDADRLAPVYEWAADTLAHLAEET